MQSIDLCQGDGTLKVVESSGRQTFSSQGKLFSNSNDDSGLTNPIEL